MSTLTSKPALAIDAYAGSFLIWSRYGTRVIVSSGHYDTVTSHHLRVGKCQDITWPHIERSVI